MRIAITLLTLSTVVLSYRFDPCWAEEGIFEVKATAVDSAFYRMGKIEKDRPGDEVVYLVNLPQKTITRTAVYNKSVKEQSPDSPLSAAGDGPAGDSPAVCP